MSWSLLISIDNILFINQVRLKFWRIHLKGHQYLFILLERGTCNMFPLKETYAPSSQLTWILITKGCLEPPLFSVFKVLMNLHHFVIRSYQLHVCALLNMKKNIPHQTFKPINCYVYKMITHFTMASKSMEMCQNLDFAEKKCLQIRQVVSQNFMYGALWLPLLNIT